MGTWYKSWARLIYQVYEVDPPKYPKCGSQIKIIAFILAREEIIRILTQHSWIRTFEKKSSRQEMQMIFRKNFTIAY